MSEGGAEPEQSMELAIVNPVDADIQGAFYDLLSEDRIMVDYQAEDWESAVRQAGRLLYETGAVEEQYIEAMVDMRCESNPYDEGRGCGRCRVHDGSLCTDRNLFL